MKRLVAIAVLVTLATCATGCGNESLFTNVPDRQRPIAVIDPLAPPVESFVERELSGEASSDADGTVVAWAWTVLERPAGSGFAVPPAPSTPDGARVSIRPDLLGTYRVRLVVTDDDGLESEPAEYSFEVTSADGLRIELTWNADITDVDLHLISEQPAAAFFAEPWDCFFQNQDPDWGIAGLRADDPYLPADDDDGFGPEVIGLRAPSAGSYRILTHYYCDDGFAGTTATVRVLVDGAAILESTMSLQQTGDLWDVGTLVFGTDGAAALVASTSGVGTSTRGCE